MVQIRSAPPAPRRLHVWASRPKEFAPVWHTVTLVAVIFGVAVFGTLLNRSGIGHAGGAQEHSRITSLYLPMIVVQWGLAFYVCCVGSDGNRLRSLVGRVGSRPAQLAADVALAACGWLAVRAVEFGGSRLWSSETSASVVALLPHTSPERLTWVLVASSVGFCEEVVYRGYLQSQFTKCARSSAVAVVLQAVLFGIAHSDQGLGAMARVTLYGLGLGALARWRRSLVPGILCHTWIDLSSGLLGS